MPLLTEVAYRSWPVKIGLGLLYFVLGIGGITMVFPFALMVATSFSSEIDADELRLIPRFFYNDDALYRKYLSSKYGVFAGKFATIVSIDLYNQMHDHERQVFSFEDIEPADPSKYTDAQNAALLADWEEFRVRMVESRPGYLRAFFSGRPGWMPAWTIAGEGVEDYRAWVGRNYGWDVAAINEAYGESLPAGGSVASLLPQQERQRSPLWLPDINDPQYRDWLRWQKETSMRYADVFPLVPSWHRYLENHPDLQSATEASPAKRVNAAWGTEYPSLVSIPLAGAPPENPAEREYWKRFVRESLSRMYLRFRPTLGPLFAEALKQQFGSAEEMRRLTGTGYESFEAVPVPETVFDAAGQFRAALLQLVSGRADAAGDALDHADLVTPEGEYAAFLAERYGSVVKMNEAYGWSLASFADARIPRARLDRLELDRVKSRYKWWMALRNYRMVGISSRGTGARSSTRSSSAPGRSFSRSR
jgi:hypothetical protein